MNYYYKEKGWYYFGFEYDQKLINELKNRFKAQYNYANKEWYLMPELWNLNEITKFIKENGFIEHLPERETELSILPQEERLSHDDVKLLLPELGLLREPRNYQVEGVAYMINHGNCINGCSCGLGKTAQAIIYAEMLDLFPCIIVCPSSVKAGWKKEWGLWNPNRSISIIGTSKKKDWTADVIIINYDLLAGIETKKLLNTVKKKVIVKFPELKSREYKVIIADEIHLLKNKKANRSQAFSQIASRIENRIGLSGTIIMNRPIELQNILRLLGRYKEIFPEDEYFNYRYCNMKITEHGRDNSCASNVKELYEILSNYCYFRKEKREVLTELPPIVEQVVELELSNRKEYLKAEENLIKYLETVDVEKIEKALKAETLVQLNVLFQLTIEGKMKAIELYIKEWLESNEDSKLLVFGNHKNPLVSLNEKFEGSCLVIGDLSLNKKMSTIEDFKTKSSCRVLFANIQCIGTGVDGLQEVASDIHYIELPLRPSDLEQATSRLERMGQKNSINVTYLLAPNSIDMKMWKLLEDKKNITDQVIKGFDDNISLGLLKTYYHG